MFILEANHIVKQYGNHLALNEVSISVPKGSIFGLLGPNGAGKTTLIRIINQITGPDSGEVLFNGEHLQPFHVEKIGYLPEERGLYKKMEVGEQSLYLAQLKGMSRREATKKLKYWFEKFEIQSWWNKKIEELSKGMAQKVQFIITIIHEPELLILDEPFSGFDPVNAEIIKNEILELKKKGTSIIFSTHNMGSVEQMCDEIALINLSKKILSGSVKEIKNQYKSNTYKVKYSGGNAIGLSNALWHRFELKNNVKEGEHFEAEIKIPDELKLNDLLSTLLSEVQILEVHEVIPNMNDIFISKVKELN